MYLMHVYLQLKITRSYISTIPATSMHYRTVPQTFRHNSGTIVHVTAFILFANGMECIITTFPLAGLWNDHSLPLCISDSLCIHEEEPDYSPTARSKVLRRFLFCFSAPSLLLFCDGQSVFSRSQDSELQPSQPKCVKTKTCQSSLVFLYPSSCQIC